MADPISDVQGLFQSFAGMAGGLKQLHDIRVQTQVNRETVKLDQMESEFLSRFYLPFRDQNRLTAEEKSWRPALAELESQMAQALEGSSGDERIRNAISQQLSSRRTRFSLDLQATLSQAEYQLARENTISTMKAKADMGDYQGMFDVFQVAKDQGQFSPSEIGELESSMITPAKAKIIYSTARSGGGTLVEMRDRVARDTSITSSSLMAQSLGLFDAELSANGKALSDEAKNTVDVFLKDGSTGIAQEAIISLADKYAGNVRQEDMSALLARLPGAAADSAGIQIDTYVASMEATVGVSVDASGNIVGGAKKILPSVGFRMLADYERRYKDVVDKSGDVELAAKYEQGASKLRNLIGDSDGDKEAAFSAIFNPQLELYKVGQVDGRDLMATLFRHAGDLSTSSFTRYMEEIQKAGYQSETVKSMIERPELYRNLALMARDDSQFKKAKAVAAAFADGDWESKVDAVAGQAFLTMTEEIIDLAASGKYMSSAELTSAIRIRLASFEEDLKRGVFEHQKKDLSDIKYSKNLGQFMDGIAYKDKDVYGNDLPWESREEIWRFAAPIALDAVKAVESATGSHGISASERYISIDGADGNKYVLAQGLIEGTGGWKKTAYRVSGNGSGITVQPVIFDGSESNSQLIDIIRRRGLQAGRAGKLYSANEMLSLSDGEHKYSGQSDDYDWYTSTFVPDYSSTSGIIPDKKPPKASDTTTQAQRELSELPRGGR